MRALLLVVAGCASGPRPGPSTPAIACDRRCQAPPKVGVHGLPPDVDVALTPPAGQTFAVPPFRCSRDDGVACAVTATEIGRAQATRIELTTPHATGPILLRLTWATCNAYRCVLDRGVLRL